MLIPRIRVGKLVFVHVKKNRHVTQCGMQCANARNVHHRRCHHEIPPLLHCGFIKPAQSVSANTPAKIARRQSQRCPVKRRLRGNQLFSPAPMATGVVTGQQQDTGTRLRRRNSRRLLRRRWVRLRHWQSVPNARAERLGCCTEPLPGARVLHPYERHFEKLVFTGRRPSP